MAIASGTSMVEREVTDHVVLRAFEFSVADPLALQTAELVDDEAEGLRGIRRLRISLGDHRARILVGIEVRRCAIGQLLLRSQDLLQTVRAFAAKNLDRLVDGFVVVVLAGNRDVADADLRSGRRPSCRSRLRGGSHRGDR